jgi:hemoglobin
MRDPNSIYVPPSGPPQGPLPSSEIYAAMGKENIFALCRDFYSELEQSSIKNLFGGDMPQASEKLAMFLVSASGGPPLYQQSFGPPRMRARHLPFTIGAKERQVWLDCFYRVLEDAPERYNFPRAHLDNFKQYLSGFSAWMINSKE